MIKLTEFLPVPEPASTKVKFNMRSGGGAGEAWDLLMDDHEDWLNLSRYRSKQANHNMGEARNLLAFAQYYPYGPQYFIFGGFFGVRPVVPEVLNGSGYELEPLPLHSEYIKRLIVKLDQPLGRQVYLRRYEGLQAQLICSAFLSRGHWRGAVRDCSWAAPLASWCDWSASVSSTRGQSDIRGLVTAGRFFGRSVTACLGKSVASPVEAGCS